MSKHAKQGDEMKTLTKILMSLSVVALVVSCGSAPSPAPGPVDMPKPTAAAIPATPMDLPDWYVNTPEEDDTYIYGTGDATSRKMNIAISKANQSAQTMISARIQATVQSQVKNFSQEAGMDENTQVVEFYQEASKTVTNNTMTGLQVLKKYPYMMPGGSYHAYVLVGLKKDAVEKALVNQIKDDKALYSEFKASQAFKELEAATGGTLGD
ncbi:MAG: hypothetical protein CO167_02705 [Candidatus Marinimicrobia bacterium CG_4_9_14_3_um_filter_48_9]|nr:MAG: hypothetical protein CO167_02705 [Candidatus Marinimicrobia bacterium CG_4_9_14_3_um_filter_48_9]